MKIKINLSGKIIISIALVSGFFISPFPAQGSYMLGNIFFGGAPKLYNISFSKFFFSYAANPLIGKPAPYANHQLSRTYFIQGKLDESLRIAKKELEIYPDHQATWYIIGLTLGYMNKEKEAIDAFGKYIIYNPKTWAARNDKAWLQFRIGDIDGAIATIEPVVEIQQYNPWIKNTYCALMLQKKNYKKALEACEQAKEILAVTTEESWGKAYPGNDPRIYKVGLQAMKLSVDNNIALIQKKIKAQ